MKKLRKIEIVAYDPNWPQLFQELSRIILTAAGDLILRIEHVGSTSVHGLDAKPIIDLDVVISTRDYLPEISVRLAGIGYVHNGDQGVEGREAFKRESEDVPRDGTGRNWPMHHLYICAEGNPELIRHVTFRDYLRNSPEAAKAYEKLKYQLAQQYQYNADAYCEAKTSFIKSILEKVRSEAR
jgi:GrpB-like predicted nucleotidyltransferase (UPF0157 family)